MPEIAVCYDGVVRKEDAEITISTDEPPYPDPLTPNSTETLLLPSGDEVQLSKASPTFERWTGEFMGDTYGNKPVVDLDGEPMFAELAILGIFQKDGWEGVWVDTYRRTIRASMDDSVAELPGDKQRLLREIYERAGAMAGCFDVFWKNDSVVFAESKRKAKDRIRPTQLRWVQAALNFGLPTESLLIVEWSLVG